MIVKRIRVAKNFDNRDWWLPLMGQEFDVSDCYEASFLLKGEGGRIPKSVCEVLDYEPDDDIDDYEEQEVHICDNCILNAREQALDIAHDLNESKIDMGMFGKDELLSEAEEIFQWLLKGSK